jgi:hypothetical protein
MSATGFHPIRPFGSPTPNGRSRPIWDLHAPPVAARIAQEADIRVRTFGCANGSCQFVEQHLRLFKIWRAEALGEPFVDRRSEVAGLGAAALVPAEPGEACSGAQSPNLASCSRAIRQAVRYSPSALGAAAPDLSADSDPQRTNVPLSVLQSVGPRPKGLTPLRFALWSHRRRQ